MLNLLGYFKINLVDVLFKDFQARLDVGVTFDDLVSAIRIQTGFQLIHVWVFDALGKSHLGFNYLVHALVVVNKETAHKDTKERIRFHVLVDSNIYEATNITDTVSGTFSEPTDGEVMTAKEFNDYVTQTTEMLKMNSGL